MRRFWILLFALLLPLLASCGGTASPPEPSQEITAPEPAPPAEQEDTAHVADASQMTAVEDVVEEGMTPLFPESLREGVYSVRVDSSSSMFKIADCALRVENGIMEACLTMSGSAYGYLYPGTAEQAAAADRADYLPAGEDGEGRSTFVLPVEALDAGVPCAAWSRNKELWYDRTLVFRADSLPLSAFAEGVLTTPESLALPDGDYTVEVRLAGGSGKASVASPAPLAVEGGVCTARLTWSSPHYDYVLLGGERYLPVNTEGNSTFLLPVPVFDRAVAVTADTVAMSQPYEIAYSLYFDSASIRPS